MKKSIKMARPNLLFTLITLNLIATNLLLELPRIYFTYGKQALKNLAKLNRANKKI